MHPKRVSVPQYTLLDYLFVLLVLSLSPSLLCKVIMDSEFDEFKVCFSQYIVTGLLPETTSAINSYKKAESEITTGPSTNPVNSDPQAVASTLIVLLLGHQPLHL